MYSITRNYQWVDMDHYEIKEKPFYRKQRLEKEVETIEKLMNHYEDTLVSYRDRLKELKKELKDLD